MTEVSTISTPEASAPRTTITPRELEVSDGERRVHFVQNDDLGVILGRGQKGPGHSSTPPLPYLDCAGLVAVSLGIDGYDAHEVHVERRAPAANVVEVIDGAIAALQAARDGVIRVQGA